MAKRKKAVTETAKPVATGNKKATKPAVDSSSAPASKKAAKTPKKKVVQKSPLETKTVCFTDKESGKKFCGEMTEVPPSKETAKIAGIKKRAALRRRKR